MKFTSKYRKLKVWIPSLKKNVQFNNSMYETSVPAEIEVLKKSKGVHSVGDAVQPIPMGVEPEPVEKEAEKPKKAKRGRR